MRRMPAEYEAHDGTILIWPVRPGSWTYGGKEAQATFTELARVIAQSETLYMCAYGDHLENVRETFKDDPNIKVLDIETNDSWARDIGPTYVDEDGVIKGTNWKFNAWGGDYDGLYLNYEEDDAFANKFCEVTGYDTVDEHDFVLEGGSIHTDGDGTLIVTETCLLSQGRNPHMTREQIEERLKRTLGVEKIIWLPYGINGDETNEHVDNICCFVKPGEVVMSWTDDVNDIQHEMCEANMRVFEQVRDAKGRKIKVHKMPLPAVPVVITEHDAAGYVYEEGEDTREVGEKLAASYANFYITNKHVIVPQFGDPNDKVACDILAKLFPDREVYPIMARSIIVGGGNIHCITQQIPKGV
ncbi:MAG: agmatine deiminase [Clostridia bacterium]|nr:agmatine deiminase [Clostridia bacterium]